MASYSVASNIRQTLPHGRVPTSQAPQQPAPAPAPPQQPPPPQQPQQPPRPRVTELSLDALRAEVLAEAVAATAGNEVAGVSMVVTASETVVLNALLQDADFEVLHDDSEAGAYTRPLLSST